MPTLGVPQAFLPYMNDLHPRLIANQAAALNTNSIHGVKLKEGGKKQAIELAGAFLNSLTLLSCEVEGRSYGGGALKLEPTEATNVLVPDIRQLDLSGLDLDYLEGLLNKATLREFLDYVDGFVLADRHLQAVARGAYVRLLSRRLLRSNKSNALERIAALGLDVPD